MTPLWAAFSGKGPSSNSRPPAFSRRLSLPHGRALSTLTAPCAGHTFTGETRGRPVFRDGGKPDKITQGDHNAQLRRDEKGTYLRMRRVRTSTAGSERMQDLQQRVVDMRLPLCFHLLRQRADIEAAIGTRDLTRGPSVCSKGKVVFSDAIFEWLDCAPYSP
jgi:hypothetical protein